MSLAGFLNDRCDIYHLRKGTSDIGYGIPSGRAIGMGYPAEPDITSVPCHFARRGSGKVGSGTPMGMAEGDVKLNLPLNVDIRRMDRIVDLRTGLSYTAGIPQNIQNSHTAVILTRLWGQGELTTGSERM